jgi:hypothetical protein
MNGSMDPPVDKSFFGASQLFISRFAKPSEGGMNDDASK